MRVEDGHEGAPLFDFMDEVENIAGITAEPIKAGDHQFVTGSHESKHSG